MGMESMRARLLGQPPADLETRLAYEMGVPKLAAFQVGTKELPHYRFVDLYRATDEYCGNQENVKTIESEHRDEALNSILHAKRQEWMSRRINRSSTISWLVGPEEDVFLPVDRFWLCTSHAQGGRLILRLRYDEYREKAVLEVAAEDSGLAERCLNRIVERSVEASIYRNKVLLLAFEPGTKDEYGDVEKGERLRILFKADEPVADEDIVIDEDVREILQRNVIDLHTKREVLKAHRVPVRRGVLFYGPPGTGKTFACRYICGKLPDTTRIIVTGTALLQVNTIFSLARLFQPSLLILEDVDLVFASREINLYSSVLGELLDQMDGLRPFEDVGFILTTNAIDRMESAIRDRPGRISQCIHFGAPTATLRKRYLLHYLRGYPAPDLDMDQLVTESSGATQAFLKEWVHRAVQMSLEHSGDGKPELELRNQDFSRAMDEMKKFSEGSTGRIIGFHASS